METNPQIKKSRIKRISTVKNEDVFDITVRNNHNFFANGVLAHNCEILLGEKSYCNLITVNLAKFNGREKELERAFWIMGRANYRQTCVDFRDDLLQVTWHELNQFLRLTGVGCAGIVMWDHHKNPKEIQKLRKIARESVDSMAKELNLPKSKAVTTVKPDGCGFYTTQLQLADGTIASYLDIFMKCGYDLEFIETAGEKVWLDLNQDVYVLDENNESQKVTKLYINGYKPVYKLTFEDGNVYEFTGNHKLKTTNGWKRVDELTEDDDILAY